MKRFFARIGRFFWPWGFLECLVALIVLVVLFYLEEDWRGAHDWAVTKAKWEARGESFDYDKLIPPPVPDQQNIAALPLFKLQPFTDTNGTTTAQAVILRHATRDDLPNLKSPSLGNWQRGEVTDLPKVRDDIAFNYTEAQKGAKPAGDTLAQFNVIYPFFINFIADAATRPVYRANLDYTIMPPFARPLGPLVDAIRLSKVLTVHAVLALDAHQADSALQDLETNLKLASGSGRDPTLVGGLVAIGVVAIGNAAIYDGLAEHAWTDGQLVELNQALEPINLLAGFQFTMRGETIQAINTFEFLRRHANQLKGDELESMSATPFRPPPWPDGWWDENISAVAEYRLKELATVDPKTHMVFPKIADELDREAQVDHANCLYTPWKILAIVSNGPMGMAVHKFAQAQVGVDEERIACALERYRLAHGVYPGTIAELAPGYIDEVPHDIMNGAPYHYRLNADGTFLLYSVGWNQTDEGGTIADNKYNPKTIDYERGDWVWPTPKSGK